MVTTKHKIHDLCLLQPAVSEYFLLRKTVQEPSRLNTASSEALRDIMVEIAGNCYAKDSCQALTFLISTFHSSMA